MKTQKIRAIAVQVNEHELPAEALGMLEFLYVTNRDDGWHVTEYTDCSLGSREGPGPFKSRLAAELCAVEMAIACATDGHPGAAICSSGIFDHFNDLADQLKAPVVKPVPVVLELTLDSNQYERLSSVCSYTGYSMEAVLMHGANAIDANEVPF